MDLGSDAVILNSKPIKTGGVFGMFGKQRIEVIAAVEEKTAEETRTPASNRQGDVPSHAMAGTYTAKQAYSRSSSTAAVHTATRTTNQETATRTSQKPFKEDLLDLPVSAPREGEQQRSHPVDAAIGTNRQITLQADANTTDQLANEVRDMRKMFEKLLVHDLNQQLPEAFQAVRGRLVEQEVMEEWAAEIIGRMMESASPGQVWTEMEARKASKTIIAEILQSSGQPHVKLDKQIKYAFFFGPTGVGKTTTIAKLAANSMLKDKRKIGFITADTYRMAAVEQLKTYANILNVPLEVVFSPKEMTQAMERLSDCDLIFVDTAGRNFRNDEYVEGIRELIQHGKNSVNYLVLGLTSKYSDMKAIIQNFSEVPVSQIIFTKADETHSYGSMLNVARETGLALSYITTGQNVPDDIMVATPEMIAAMIMGD